MQHEFWHAKWEKSEIGFHNREVHPLLAKHWDALGLAAGSRIFLPLCGKSLDIAWLLEQGYQVAGAELSELAVQQLFSELGWKPQVESRGALKCYSAAGLDVFVGDIFALTATYLGAIDGVYDRAALVALPADMRQTYAAHITALSAGAPQLLISFEYDQNLLPGPPFSVDGTELRALYADTYVLKEWDRVDVAGGLKGKCAADEVVWLLQRGG